jgi:hypothetical protein
MRRLVCTTLATGFLAGLGLGLPPGRSADVPQDASGRARDSVSGRWAITLEGPQGEPRLFVTLGQDETEITGTLNGANSKRLRVAGALAGRSLRFCIVDAAFADTCFAGRLGDDGMLSGTVSTAADPGMTWSARRFRAPHATPLRRSQPATS